MLQHVIKCKLLYLLCTLICTVYTKNTLRHWISSSVLVIILHRWTVLYLSIILQVMNSYVNTYCLFSYLFPPELSSTYRRWVRQGKDGKLHQLQGNLKIEMIRNNWRNLTLWLYQTVLAQTPIIFVLIKLFCSIYSHTAKHNNPNNRRVQPFLDTNNNATCNIYNKYQCCTKRNFPYQHVCRVCKGPHPQAKCTKQATLQQINQPNTKQNTKPSKPWSISKGITRLQKRSFSNYYWWFYIWIQMGMEGDKSHGISKNHKSAIENPEKVYEKLAKESSASVSAL